MYCLLAHLNNDNTNLVELRTWSSCAAHSTKATRTVREALLQQSLAGDKCCRAGERITELDCQGEEGRAGNNRQSKKKNDNDNDNTKYVEMLMHRAWVTHPHCPLALEQSVMGGAVINVNQKTIIINL